MTLPRKTPPKRTPIRKARKWACSHCQNKNRPGSRKCERCRIGRTTKRTSLKARCDAMARELCRLLAGGRCARCGGPGSDWAHRFPRRHHSLRWSMSNCDFLCRPCHNYLGTHPAEAFQWLSRRGVDVIALERIANEPWDKDYSRVISELSSALLKAREAA